MRRPRWILRAFVLIFVAGVIVSCGAVALAGLDAFWGYRAMRSVQSEIAGEARQSVVAERVGEAEDHFSQASERLASPLVAPLRIVPLVGRQVDAIDRLATAASEVGAITGDAIAELPSLQKKKDAGGRVALAREIARVAKRTSDRLDTVDIGERSWLITPVAAQYDRFREELDRVRSIASRAAILGDRLGPFLEGPRRYLVLAANNAEMRAGHGMFLSAGEMTISDGGFDIGEMEPTAQMRLERGAVPLGGDMKALWGSLHPNEEWRNLGVSPRFDQTGELAAEMWEARTGTEVDGVLAVDVIALRAMLRSAGPVEVDGEKLTDENIVRYVLHDQYIDVPLTDEGREARREVLADLASKTVDAIDAGAWTPNVLLSGLADAAAGRHVLAWSRHAKEQAMWEAAGVTGRLSEDSLLVAVLNRGGNKLDQFLEVDNDLSIEDGERGQRAATLRITIRNATPAGEPPYIAGPHPRSKAKAGEYLGIVAVTLPASARDARVVGVDDLQPGGRDGPTTVVGTPVSVRRGAEEVVEVRFSLPNAAGNVVLEASGRIPASDWSWLGEPITDAVGRRDVW